MTKCKTPKKRTIYDNYNVDEYMEEAKQYLIDNDNENPSEEEIWSECYIIDELNWNDAKWELEKFFDNGSKWILQGFTGRWYGAARGGFLFDNFMDAYNKATKDCDYVHIYDENGHFYIQCSHHDGTNLYEIKEVTEDGIGYLERWEDNWNDKRSEEYVHDMIMRKYSRLPGFAHKIYGCKRIEFETE